MTKILLFPLSLLYGIVVRIRLWMYEHHFLGSTDFDIPVICVGNLSMGGTGKTPMIEFLIRLFHQKYPVGVISRGYGRNSGGFVRLTTQHTATEVGDEPLLLKLKNTAAEIAVGEARVIAIPRLLSEAPHIKVILMDDGFQHLSVRPHVNILLTNYQKPFWKDQLLPMGTLREFVSAKGRANIIVVTKCPENFSEEQKRECLEQIKANENQKVFFSTLKYAQPYLVFGGTTRLLDSEKLIAVTGIADASLFIDQISANHEYVHFEFDDHHIFRLTQLQNILKNYPEHKTWITTEKDAVRLIPFRHWLVENQVALWVQPVAAEFLKTNAEDFSELMLQYLDFYYPQTTLEDAERNDAE